MGAEDKPDAAAKDSVPLTAQAPGQVSKPLTPSASQFSLELPEKLSLELHLIGPSASSLRTLTLSAEKITVEVRKPTNAKALWPWLRRSLRGLRNLAKDLGPVVIAAVVGLIGLQISRWQAQTAASNLEYQIVSQLSDPDATKRALAVAKLADLGPEKGLRYIRVPLGDQDEKVQLRAASDAANFLRSLPPGKSRAEFFDSVVRDFEGTTNPDLRMGILRFLLAMEGGLTPKEQEGVAGLLRGYLGPTGKQCNEPAKDERELILAAQVSRTLDFPVARELLVLILKNCGRFESARIQSVSKLYEVAVHAPGERASILQSLEEVESNVPPGDLKDQIDKVKQSIQRSGPNQ